MTKASADRCATPSVVSRVLADGVLLGVLRGRVQTECGTMGLLLAGRHSFCQLGADSYKTYTYLCIIYLHAFTLDVAMRDCCFFYCGTVPPLVPHFGGLWVIPCDLFPLHRPAACSAKGGERMEKGVVDMDGQLRGSCKLELTLRRKKPYTRPSGDTGESREPPT